jgi:hypothetical protein
MPWKKSEPMEERIEFGLKAIQGEGRRGQGEGRRGQSY